jgi:hypothetical protein
VSPLPQKVVEQIAKAGLPTTGTHPFRPRLVQNWRGEQVIEKKAVANGPKQNKKGYVDDQGRIWVRGTTPTRGCRSTGTCRSTAATIRRTHRHEWRATAMSQNERGRTSEVAPSAAGLGELATGSAGRWHVSVVESLDGEKL